MFTNLSRPVMLIVNEIFQFQDPTTVCVVNVAFGIYFNVNKGFVCTFTREI